MKKLFNVAAVVAVMASLNGCQMIQYIAAGNYKTPEEPTMQVSEKPAGFGAMVDYLAAGEYKTPEESHH